MSRDSWLLTLAALGALVGYLTADGRVPTDWGYQDWLKFIAFVAAWAAGKLATSPLRGEHE